MLDGPSAAPFILESKRAGYNPRVIAVARRIQRSSELIIRLLAIGLPLVVSAAYLRLGARTPAGSPMLPLDDAYIHLQYAWQAAHGQFMQYNPGDAPTSGATSLLYLLLLASGFLAGFSKDSLPWAVLGLGLVLYVASTLLLTDLARRAARALGIDENLSAVLALALFAGSGWMAWSFMSGMETGLLIAFVSLVLWAQVTRRLTLMVIAGALAALTRPEAALLPAALLLAEFVWAEPGRSRLTSALAGLAVALGAAAVPPAINYFFTGSFSASGMLAKSLFTLVPFQWSAVASGFGASMLDIWAGLFGGWSSDGHWHAFPLLQAAAVAGIVLLIRNPVGRRLATVGAAWLLLGTAATATLQTATWHHYRYQMPFYPALLILGSIGLASLAGPAARWLRGRPAAWLLILAPVWVWNLYAIQDFALEYSRDSQTAAQMQLPLALWLSAHTPVSARIAVHDIGIVRYFSERSTIDVVGLTTANMAQAYRNGPGSIYEALEQSQPDYYGIYPNLAPPYFGIASAADLFGPELFRVMLPNYSHVTSAGDTQVVTQPDWSRVALTQLPRQPSTLLKLAGLALVDSVNVADLAAEAAHHYHWWNQAEVAGFPTDARVMAYRQAPSITLGDGGRLLTGGESFVLTIKPATPLVLVSRLHQTADMILDVTVNQTDLGEWRLPAVPGQWLESSFTVDPQYLASATAQVVLTVKNAPPGTRYSPFYYWAYQGSAAQPANTAPQPAAAVFGAVARLVGFDAPQATLGPGQSLRLTLYWQAIQPDHANYKVFVHLMNPADDTAAGILAQIDEAPLAGTDPFWIWRSGETVSEPITLDIPPQAKAGNYLLLAGLYNADTGERLPISGAPDFGSARLRLAQVDIR